MAQTMEMLNMTKWIYMGFVAFPNANREVLEETGLVKKDDEFKVIKRKLLL